MEGFDIFLSHTWQTNAIWKASGHLHKGWSSTGRCIDAADELALLLVELLASNGISVGALPLAGAVSTGSSILNGRCFQSHRGFPTRRHFLR